MTKPKTLWFSRQRDGNYTVTYLKPIYAQILGTKMWEHYAAPGEPIGVRHCCPGGIKSVFGVEMEIGESKRFKVAVTAEELKEMIEEVEKVEK